MEIANFWLGFLSELFYWIPSQGPKLLMIQFTDHFSQRVKLKKTASLRIPYALIRWLFHTSKYFRKDLHFPV